MSVLLSYLGRIAATLSAVPGLARGRDGLVLYLTDPAEGEIEATAAAEDFLAWQINWVPDLKVCPDLTPQDYIVGFTPALVGRGPSACGLDIDFIGCACFRCRTVRHTPAMGGSREYAAALCVGVFSAVRELPQFKAV